MLTHNIASDDDLAERVGRHVTAEGYNDTVLHGLRLVAAACQRPRQPQCYEPGLIFILQGEKTGYLDGRVIHYGPGQYLVQAMPLPFECETHVAGDAPLLGAILRIDAELLAELMADWPQDTSETDADEQTLPMAAVAMNPAMREALSRLLACLDDPVAARIVAESRRREVIFEALRGPQGHLLRQLLAEQSRYARIGRAIARLQARYAAPVRVADLAAEAHMSVSSFHVHFKRVTQLSPLQYQKQIRLLRAREQLIARAGNVAAVASAVGYQSASQFSREYKRYFGVAPIIDNAEESMAM